MHKGTLQIQELWRIGLKNCGLDSSAPNNTVFRTPVVVFDTEAPFSSATGNSSTCSWHDALELDRKICLHNEWPCTAAAGFFDCPSGCYKLPCQLVKLVTTATKPVLSLSTAMAGLAGGSGRLLIQYGSSAGMALLPCSSQSELCSACTEQHSMLKPGLWQAFTWTTPGACRCRQLRSSGC